MDFALPLYAVERLADGTWLVRSPSGDPILPPVDVVVVVGAQTDIRRDPESCAKLTADCAEGRLRRHHGRAVAERP